MSPDKYDGFDPILISAIEYQFDLMWKRSTEINPFLIDDDIARREAWLNYLDSNSIEKGGKLPEYIVGELSGRY